MFDLISDKLEGAFKALRGHSTISETNVRDAMREIKMALLEADVNFKVVKDFCSRVQEQALGAEVLQSVSPSQQFTKIVYDELVTILGGDSTPLEFSAGRTNVIMMLGLQGAGKTTFCGKLAMRFVKEGRRVLLVACDIHRPAAVTQLHVVGEQAGATVHSEAAGTPAPTVAARAMERAKAEGFDIVIVDTAGRLHIDEVKMEELADVRDTVRPTFTFLVADAMTGQDAVTSASTFNDKIGIDGVCLTKMDGDARGGAALSIRTITGKPVRFIGTGEKLDDLSEFHADRMASRILGMGDVVSLVEKAQEAFDEKEAKKLDHKMRTASFTLQDFLEQMQRIRKMGPLRNLLEMLPGVGKALRDVDIPEDEMRRTEAIIQSMTQRERDEPELLNGSRKTRIAKGAGVSPQQVNDLIDRFEQGRKMMQQMMRMTDTAKNTGGDPAAMRSALSGTIASPREAEKRQQRKAFEKKQKQKQRKMQRQKKK